MKRPFFQKNYKFPLIPYKFLTGTFAIKRSQVTKPNIYEYTIVKSTSFLYIWSKAVNLYPLPESELASYLMINVSKPYLPPFEEYSRYLEGIWSRVRLTNHGPLVTELENQLKEYLGVKYVVFVSSGTSALQIALKSFELQGQVITTPFSYISGVNAILWGNCQPIFVDIEDKSFCIDPSKIEASITTKTSAILATHVYGYPCDVEQIQAIAEKNGLKVIYDAAHAFGVAIQNQSIFNFGDVTAVSFHATKLYHTIEGGAIITNNELLAKKCILLRAFGLQGTKPYCVGINGKNSEFHAAMGLCNLPKVRDFIQKQQEIAWIYKSFLQDLPIQFPQCPEGVKYNYAYFPIVFPSEERLLSVKSALENLGINTRRYFYPSLNKLPYLTGADCPIAESVAQRILCLPSYYELSLEDTKEIAQLIVKQYHL